MIGSMHGLARGFAALLLALLPLSCVAQATNQTTATEAQRVVEILRLEPGMVVAEIGSGNGELTLDLARELGDRSRIYSTELKKELGSLQRKVRRSGLSQIKVVEAGVDETNLPPGCCDAIFMKRVYHHFKRPQLNNESLLRSLKPGGYLAIIDFEPRKHWDMPEGVPENRGGHGIDSSMLIRELQASGFQLVEIDSNWSSDLYAAVFRKPL